MPVNNPFALTFSGNITQWDGTNLGQPTVWGTPATGQTVIGVNAELFAGSAQLSATGSSLNVNVTGGATSGTQYTDETAESAGVFIGTVAMGYNGTEVVGLRLNSSNELIVNVSGTTTISGNVNQTVGVAGFEKITDGTNTAAVKAASTAPVATDPALVVTISPNSAAITADSSGSGTSNSAAAVWNNGTTLNSTVAVYSTNFSYNTAVITFDQTTTVSGGAVTFEVSNDGTNWVPLNGVPTEGGSEVSSYQFQASTYISFTFNVSGWQNFRVRLSTAMTGSGTITVGYAVQTTGTPVSAVIAAKDSGRNYLSFYIDAVSGITSEALETMTINSGGNTSTGTTYTVTAGKTLRLQSISVACQETNSTVQTSKVRLRSAGAVTATSPVLWGTFISTSGATHAIGNSGAPFPDGLEIAGGQQIAISHVESATATNVTVSLVGYEY